MRLAAQTKAAGLPGRSGWCSLNGVEGLLHYALGRFVVVVLQPVFVAHHLAVELIDQLVHGGVQVCVRAFGKQIAAAYMDIAFRSLSSFFFFLLFHSEQYFDVYNLVKMAGNSI
jgi:hypothetical protein